MNIRQKLNKKRNASALMIVSFISMISILLIASMSTITSSNVEQVVYDKDGKTAYYAAESGLAEVSDYLNANFTNWGIELANTDLPTTTSPSINSNSSEYWVDTLTYANDNKIAIVDIIGEYNGAYRKIRARIESTIPKYFDDYGLLTNGILTINGDKTLEMSIHANDGLSLSGPTTTEFDSVATQSTDPNAEEPDPITNPVGGYVDIIEVPKVPIEALRASAQQGLVIDAADPDYNQKIMDAPDNTIIYVTNPSLVWAPIDIEGDMGSKIIFVDRSIVINAQGLNNLSNVMVISSGNLIVNGSIDFISSHPDQIDVVFASEEDIVLNGSRDFNSLFWTNGRFTQNGSSMAGRVIAQNGISFNGKFTLNASDNLYDYGTFNNVATLSSWQQVAMDD